MKGFTRDPALRVRARELRGEGLTYRAIGEALDVPLKTASSWCLDPDEAKHRARRAQYAGVCECCGEPTDGSRGPGKAPSMCLSCLEWPEEAIVGAMQDWAEAHGGVPPSCTDWRSTHGGANPSNRAAARFGWNQLLLKAGFALTVDRRPETQATMEQMLRDGRSGREIAEHFGCSESNVYQRMKSHGVCVRDLRRVA
jgi:hypothetical protein